MSELELKDLHAKVGRVRRRQYLQRFLQALPWCLTGGLVLALAWWLVQPWLGAALAWWTPFLAALGAGLLAAASWVMYHRPTGVDSALALDDAFDLKERVTTVLTLNGELRDSPAGVALLEDTRAKVDGLDVASRFPLSLPRSAVLVPVAALGFALLVFLYDPSVGKSNIPDKAVAENKKEEPLVDKNLLEKVKEERKRRTKDPASEDAEKLDDALDRIIDKLDKANKQADVQLAIQDMTQLGEEIRKRQEELSSLKEITKKLQNDSDLKKKDEGPTKDLKDALSKADLEKAKEEIKKLADQLKKGELSEEQKKELQNKLKELEQKLKDLAEQKERRERIEKSNMDPEQKKKELAKLDKEMKKLQDLKNLADKLSQCQQSMQQGNMQEAAQSLGEALDQLQLDEKELQQLQQMAMDLDKLKECSH
jgi:hypothetical protein